MSSRSKESQADSGSDLDLDLRELDPRSSSSHKNGRSTLQNTLRETRSPRRVEQDRGSRIELQNLSGNVPRRKRGYGNAYDEVGADEDQQDEDLQGLLNDEDFEDERRTYSGYHRRGDSDVPLFQSKGYGRARKWADEEGPMSRLSSKIRLPNFASFAKKSQGQSPESANEEEEEEEDEHDPQSTRTVSVGRRQTTRYPPNAVSNAKYTPWSFLPLTLYNEFSFFFNLYFLLVALSQIIPALRIGYLSTYIAPLAFVLAITLGKEALDDMARRRRDADANAEAYTTLEIFEGDGEGLGRKEYGRKTLGKFASSRTRPPAREYVPVGDQVQNLETEESDETDKIRVFEIIKKSKDLKVGDILKMGKDTRVPADVVILQSRTNEASVGVSSKSLDETRLLESNVDNQPEENPNTGNDQSSDSKKDLEQQSDGGSGETFLRTDQLDGETDWKLRLATPLTQSLDMRQFKRLRISAGKPDKKVNEFVGTLELLAAENGLASVDPTAGFEESMDDAANTPGSSQSNKVTGVPLGIDNTAWANTVLASNSTTLAVVVYTGRETRQALSTAPSRSKTGLLEYEINALTKILCILTLSISVVLVGLEGFESTPERKWYVAIMRFLILFSTIIPISLRVNLDMGKTVYAWFIERDQGIRGAVVRTSTIPEDLGRIEYLLSDKTGTLTQNEMELKKIHVGTVSYANEAMDEVSAYVQQGLSAQASSDVNQHVSLVTPASSYLSTSNTTATTRSRREIGARVRDIVLALALCHNVTPTSEKVDGQIITAYQASSPDEIAIIKWTEAVGLRLVHRDRQNMALQSTQSGRIVVRVRILDVFPFTSEGKRMGIIVEFAHGLAEEQAIENESEANKDIWFYQKGADTVMTSIVAANDWLDEETANMAREGLRTLVVGRKKLTFQQYQDFQSQYKQASLALYGRDSGMAAVIKEHLEHNLELLGVTGVEDRLQKDVKPSLELLRNAGIKIWMLTGDKVETARCVAISAKLVARGQYIHTIAKLKRKDLAQDSLDFLQSKADACLLIDGESLALFLTHFRDQFISLAVLLPTVVACRCSPTQKAEIAKLIRAYTKKRICCIGDGGNDVSMIQAADVGVGIVGKEGRQASLAADFSIEQFCHLTKLLVWHGRNSYKRSAKLAQFVIHRGLIISVCQTMYSIASKFEPNALYKDWLLVGYATIYTMFPVFSLVLDKDVDEDLANLYPELYKELTTGRSLSYRTFFVWVLVSIYQGGMIQGLSQILVDVDGPRMVAVSFTVLVINELIMVAFEITTWHPVMIITLLGTAFIYFGSIPFLGGYFDLSYVVSIGFLWRVLAISAISLIPPYSAKLLRRTLKPPSYRKVQGF